MTSYYQCVSCRRTSEQEHCKVTINDQLICPHCLEAVEFAFSVCTADSPEPSLGYCDGCDELEVELHLVNGDWICDKCRNTVIAVQEDKAKAKGYWCEVTGEQIEPQDVEPYGHPKHGLIDVCPCHHLELAREKPAPRESIAIDTRHYSEDDLKDVEKDCADHWEMIKAHVFITLFLVWVCFAVWSKYVS